MLRLTFFDGTGLDYAYWLANYSRFLFAIIVIYLCATAFGIFNGLIGVFGQIFNRNSSASFGIDPVEERIKALEDKIEERFTAYEKKIENLIELMSRPSYSSAYGGGGVWVSPRS